MKKIVSIVLILFLLCGCAAKQSGGADGEQTQSQSPTEKESSGRTVHVSAMYSPTPVTELVADSTCIFEGTFLREESIDGMPYTWLLVFHLDRVLKGELTGDTVSVRTSMLELTEDVKYLVFCNGSGSVFEGKQTILSSSDAVSQGPYGLNVQSGLMGTEGKTYDDVVLAVEMVIASDQSNTASGGQADFCASDDLREIYDFSNTVVVAVPTAISFNGVGDRTTYECSVERTLKGEQFETILVTAMKDSLELGQSVLLLLTQHDAGSRAMVISSQNSVYPADSDEARQILSFS